MAEAGGSTYSQLLNDYVARGVIAPGDSVFVQFAGAFDARVCKEAGLSNVTLANIAPESISSGLGAGESFDAHRMPHSDSSFDHVIGHSGLHHCSRPHEAVHEMYRMARKLVLFVENQDSLLMRFAARYGAAATYEHPAVADGGGTSGGVDGTGVPNFVYRWTRREVRKMVATFDPGMNTPIEFFTEWNLASNRVAVGALRAKLRLRTDRQADLLFSAGQSALNLVAARQGNIFAVGIRKDLAQPHPWILARDAD